MAIDQPDTEQNIEFEIGSGNIFADIGFDNAEEMLLKSELVRQVNRTIKDRDLNSIQVKKTLSLDENMLSNLAQGRLTELTIENLFRYLNILGRDLEIALIPNPSPSGRREPDSKSLSLKERDLGWGLFRKWDAPESRFFDLFPLINYLHLAIS